MNIVNNDRITKIISVVLTVVLGVLFVSLVANAVTTISGTTITLENNEVISNATDGVIQLGGIASSTSVTLLNGETITNATDGTVALTGAFSVSGATTLTGDVTMSGGDGALVITTANNATSTIQVGCIQTTATSTLTPVRLVLSSAGTTTATFGAGTASGGVSWQYGTCPI